MATRPIPYSFSYWRNVFGACYVMVITIVYGICLMLAFDFLGLLYLGMFGFYYGLGKFFTARACDAHRRYVTYIYGLPVSSIQVQIYSLTSLDCNGIHCDFQILLNYSSNCTNKIETELDGVW